MNKAFLWVTAAVCLIASGCSCGAGTCQSAAQCGADEVCLQIQSCASKCSTNAECGGGEKCSGGGGCVPVAGCGADVDCGADICSNAGACIAKCQQAGCPGNEQCASSGHCIPQGQDAGPPSCGGELFKATRVQANFLLVLDSSGSMKEEIQGTSKWSLAVDAVKAVTTKHDAEIRFGMQLFSTPKGRCDPGSVVVPVGDRSASAIAAALPADAEGSGTPIGAALQVASNVSSLVDANRSNNILLVTDGMENCNGDPVAAVRAISAKNIKTYVVGFGGEVDAQNLSAMATAGGTARAGSTKYYQADDAAALNTALSSIAQGAIGCDFKLAKLPPDPSKIFVYVNGQLVARDPSRASGWDYSDGNSRVTLFGATCAAVSQSSGANVHLIYGCPDETLVEGGPGGGGSGGPGDEGGSGRRDGGSGGGGSIN